MDRHIEGAHALTMGAEAESFVTVREVWIAEKPTFERQSSSRTRCARENGQNGAGLLELLIAMAILMILMGMVSQSFLTMTQVTARESTQSDATSKARGAMETIVNSLRDDFVEFNTSGTSLGVNFDLNDGSGNPVVRDGILYYIDSNHTAQIYNASSGLPQTAGFDDANGDGFADVIGVGLVPQNLNIKSIGYKNNGYQDFIDLNNNGVADDLDGDGNADPLWTLTMVHFNKLSDVTNVTLWKQGRILATNLYIRKLVPTGALSGPNIDTFQFSAHNPIAMLYDQIASPYNGNGDTIVEENELGNMADGDGIIDSALEISSIDSVTITLHVAEVVNKGPNRIVALSDISSDLITPRTLQLMRQNGIVGVPDPTSSGNIN